MKEKLIKTGLAMGLLLLPVFLYLLVSTSNRPDTVVPNEYKKSLLKYFPNNLALLDAKIRVCMRSW